MSRVIKFRVWFEGTKDMFELDDMYFFEEGGYHSFKEAEKYGYKFLQYTGLKDKNGKELYEGDIVKIGVKRFENDKDYIASVYFQEFRGSFSVKMGRCCNNDLFRYVQNGNTVEVIGNIYENQELLGN